MRFRLLGPVEVEAADRVVPVPRRRERCLLALLLLEANRVVPVRRLARLLWDGDPPERARRIIYGQVSRMRALLTQGNVTLTRVGDGYRIEVDPESVDAHQFLTAIAHADRADGLPDRIKRIRAALSLWRGQPLENAASNWLRERACGDLIERRLAAVEDLMSAYLALRREREVLPELTRAAEEHPERESLVGLHMRALYQAGRRSDALAVYDRARAYLAEEFGLDPGPELRELHQAILRDELEVPAPQAGTSAGSGTGSRSLRPPVRHPGQAPPVPCQLPADVVGFTGFTDQLRQLDALLAQAATTAVPIVALTGTAGVGKTALAVHWAHRVRQAFPDGQLYVNLRGYDPAQPLAPAEVLSRFLAALGVASHEIPVDLDERAARFRTELAGRRLLMVLDNAADTEQLRPLLPGNGACMVLVTSRDSLVGLVAVHGAHRLQLHPLPPEDAIALLRLLVGPRVDAEPDAGATLAAQCARLPLALRVAAELASSRPGSPLSDLVAELADRQRSLDLLDAGGDPHAAVTEVFSWSVQHLPPAAARTFQLLGLHPGPDIDAHATAALTGASPDQAHRVLETLTRAHLVNHGEDGRYSMHDLLRGYALRLATTARPEAEREMALTRLLDYYLATASAAMDTLYPATSHRRPRITASATGLPELTGPEAARSWLDAERVGLVAVASYAAGHGWPSHAVQLSRTLFSYLDGGHFTDALTIHGIAHRAAEQSGHLADQGDTLRHLGVTYQQLGRYGQATDLLRQALVRSEQAANPLGVAYSLNSLGVTAARQGKYGTAADFYRRALAMFRRTSDQHGEALALNNLGAVEERRGRYAAAMDHYRQALVRFRRVRDVRGEAYALTHLGNTEQQQGLLSRAAGHHRQALRLFRRIGSVQGEADALDNLGNVYNRLGEPEHAAQFFRQALSRFQEIGDRDGEAQVHNGRGEAALAAGRPEESLACHTEARALAAAIGARAQQARALAGLGNARRSLGHLARARGDYTQALALYIELEMPEAAHIRTQLAVLTDSPGRPALSSPDPLRPDVARRPSQRGRRNGWPGR